MPTSAYSAAISNDINLAAGFRTRSPARRARLPGARRTTRRRGAVVTNRAVSSTPTAEQAPVPAALPRPPDGATSSPLVSGPRNVAAPPATRMPRCRP